MRVYVYEYLKLTRQEAAGLAVQRRAVVPCCGCVPVGVMLCWWWRLASRLVKVEIIDCYILLFLLVVVVVLLLLWCVEKEKEGDEAR